MIAQLLQIFISLSAILLLSFMVWVLFPRSFGLDRDIITKNLARLEPEETLQNLLITADAKAGLAQMESGEVFGLRLMGRDVSIRKVTPDATITQDATMLNIDFDDFTMPTLALEFDAEQCKTAQQWLKNRPDKT